MDALSPRDSKVEMMAHEWYKTNLPKHSKKLEVIHFNDVYNLEEHTDGGPIVAGCARFVSALDKYGSKDKLVLFSGDFFFPSNLSTFFNGKQMLKPFERMNVDVSCLGNHELEIGMDHGIELIKQTSCPWLMSNLIALDNDSKPIAECEAFTVVEAQGFKIGVMGFAEEAWLDQLPPCVNVK